jgi:hypothetical protein
MCAFICAHVRACVRGGRGCECTFCVCINACEYEHIRALALRGLQGRATSDLSVYICRVGRNHIYTVFIR